jgi:hypothetical protein
LYLYLSRFFVGLNLMLVFILFLYEFTIYNKVKADHGFQSGLACMRTFIGFPSPVLAVLKALSVSSMV